MASAKQKRQKKANRGEALTLEQLKILGEQLLSSRAHINNLSRLLSFLSPSSPPEFVLESLLALQPFFLTLLPDIQSSPPHSKLLGPGGAGEQKDSEVVYKAWLRSRFDEFVNSLIGIAVSPLLEGAVRDVVLDAIMEFVKLGKGGRFQSAIYHRFLHQLVDATPSVDHLLDLLAPKFFKFIDVSYFTYTSLDKISRNCKPTNTSEISKVSPHENGVDISESRLDISIRNIYNILSRIPPVNGPTGESNCEIWSLLGLPSKEEDIKPSSEVSPVDAKPPKSKNPKNKVSSATHITKKLKAKFTKAWISFLKLPLSLDVYKEVLVTLPHIVFPHVANPVILCDFLTRSYDIGGVISVMALSSLFILITQHGVEYPNFYNKLYALLTPAIFMAKHRTRFLQLLDTSLKSSHLPAYLAASFAKKLSRLALSAPPSGSLVIIAIIHNLLRRHPSINFLVHQLVGDETDGNGSVEANQSAAGNAMESDAGSVASGKKDGLDSFNIEESDLVRSGAMRSSLWEVDTLRHHYCPAVSRFVASLENDLTVRAKTCEVTVADFCSGSYATIFREEIRRRIKQVPLAFYRVTPTSIFSETDFPGWTFGNQLCDKGNGNVEKNATSKAEGNELHISKRQRIECS